MAEAAKSSPVKRPTTTRYYASFPETVTGVLDQDRPIPYAAVNIAYKAYYTL